MPQHIVNWTWDEAFDKFGFEDGDGLVFTHEVARFLESNGYAVTADQWGWHNTVISQVRKDGLDVVPQEGPEIGYDCPSTYLPSEVVELLDKQFGPVSGGMSAYSPAQDES